MPPEGFEQTFPESTPRPWYFDGWDIFTAFNSAGVRGDGHRLVVPLSHLNDTFHPSQRVKEDDARLIVEAVNAYDELRAERDRLRDALTRARREIREIQRWCDCGAVGQP